MVEDQEEQNRDAKKSGTHKEAYNAERALEKGDVTSERIEYADTRADHGEPYRKGLKQTGPRLW